MKIYVKVAKDKRAIDVAFNATLSQVASLITQTFDGDLAVSSLTLLFKGRAFKPGHSQRDAETILHNAGIREGATLMALANSAKSVQQAIDSSADDPLMRGIEEELALTARRRRAAGGPPKIVHGKHTFQKYYALPVHELPGARPPPQKALDLLHRLAADPGIVAIMAQEEFTVGCLSEMPPQDFMDDTRAVTCLLGLNISRGQEIKLRLRTNDLKGFRNYERIRETLVHELTHNVWGDHDNNFKELNSRLLRECVRVSRMHASATTLLGSAEVRDAEPMEEDAPVSGPQSHVLGGRGQGGASAAQAAAAAAARRQAAATGTQAQGRVDVTRDFEQAVDQQTQAEEAALAAWGSTSLEGSPQESAGLPTGPAGQAGASQAVLSEAVLAALAPEQQAGVRPAHSDGAAAEQSAGSEHHLSQGAPAAEGSKGDTEADTPMLEADDDAGRMPSEVVHETVHSIGQMLWRQHGGDALVALRTVQNILRNAAERQEPKYRCIRRQNEVFAARVARFPEAEVLLTVAGFQLQDDAWTLPAQHSPHTLVRVHAEVAQVLQRCQ